MAEASKSVPCGTCSLCCYGPVFLFPDEDASGLETVVARRIDGKILRRLVMKPDGACTHLVDGKCSVYDHRPRICAKFDCRDHYFLPSAERRRREAMLGPESLEVLARGRELVEAARKP